jgi:hypothetical protein
MSLPTLESVQKLQGALHAKAKGEPKFRFYALYDKVYRKDVLWLALRRCRINGGKPGVDGQTFEDIERYGVTKWLEELADVAGARGIGTASQSPDGWLGELLSSRAGQQGLPRRGSPRRGSAPPLVVS